MSLIETKSPWDNLNPSIGLYEIVTFPIGLCLFLIRAPLFIVGALLQGAFAHISMCCWKRNDQPMPNWRSSLMRFSAFMIGRWSLFCFGCWWVKVEWVGKRLALSQLPQLIVSNHTSYLDTFVHAYIFHGPAFVSKAGILEVPIIGKITSALQSVFVDRKSTKAKVGFNAFFIICNGFAQRIENKTIQLFTKQIIYKIDLYVSFLPFEKKKKKKSEKKRRKRRGTNPFLLKVNSRSD